MKTLLCCLGLLLALPASAHSVEAALCRVSEPTDVARMEASEKLCRSFIRAMSKLPDTAAEQARGMLTPESLQALTVMTAAWMGTQGVPIVGEAVDAALLALGVTLLAGQMNEVAHSLWTYSNLARSARSDGELDEAASHLSKAMATAGVNLVGFILTKRAVSRPGSGPPAAAKLSFARRGATAASMSGATSSSASSLLAADVAVVMATGSPGSTPTQAPGKWEPVKPSGSERSRLYQQQITGRPATQVYKVRGVEFDGFKDGVLLEAKGPGYESFFEPNGQPLYWYRNSGSFKGMMDQARRQAEVARDLGIPLRWHVAEAETAAFLRQHFTEQGLHTIEVLHTPMLP